MMICIPEEICGTGGKDRAGGQHQRTGPLPGNISAGKKENDLSDEGCAGEDSARGGGTENPADPGFLLDPGHLIGCAEKAPDPHGPVQAGENAPSPPFKIKQGPLLFLL